MLKFNEQGTTGRIRPTIFVFLYGIFLDGDGPMRTAVIRGSFSVNERQIWMGSRRGDIVLGKICDN